MVLFATLLDGNAFVLAQPPPGLGGAPGGPPPDARDQQPFDLTGYWVSMVTQNWRYRMVVPGRGEYGDVPLNDAAKTFADAWIAARDIAAGKQCEAYGAAAIMRVPEHLRISWRDANTLQVQTDAGMQTRVFYFRPTPELAAQPTSWQGHSVAKWNVFSAGPPGPPPAPRNGPRYGDLEISTDHMLPGLLRKNGVPYSDQAALTENWEVNVVPDGSQWLTVTTELQDPQYLFSPFFFNSIFKKQADGSGWDPSVCTLDE